MFQLILGQSINLPQICSDTSFFFGFSLDFSDLLWYGIVLTGTEGSKSMKKQQYTVQYTPQIFIKTPEEAIIRQKGALKK